ncbi:MAG TPA: hypothetical protein VK939_02265 [Longimicrobiales bacterium]|nr:hypothetical protein [Longimicrobiales bacterium]
MEVLPVDLTALVAVVMGTLMFLIPIAGFTLRFAIKPIAEAMARMREGGNEREALALLERRMSLLEQELHGLGGMREDFARLLEEAEFQRQLRGPDQP